MSILISVQPDMPVIAMQKLSEKNKGAEHLFILLTPLDDKDEDGNSRWITIGLLEEGVPICFTTANQARWFISAVLRSDTGIVSTGVREMMIRAVCVAVRNAWTLNRRYIFPDDLVALTQDVDQKIVDSHQ